MDFLSVDHDSKGDPPGFEEQTLLEGTDLAIDATPMFALSDQTLEINPSPERHLDRKTSMAAGQESDDVVAEEGAIEAEVEPVALSQRLANLSEEIVEEVHRRLTVVDVAGAVLDSEDMPGLADMGGDREVAGDLAMMGIEPSECSFDLETSRDDRPIDIDGKRAKRHRGQYPADDLGVEGHKSRNDPCCELLEPAAESSGSGKVIKTTEPVDQGIAGDEGNMVEPTGADDEHADQQPDHGDDAEITPEINPGEVAAQQLVEPNAAKVADQQFQTSVRGEPSASKLDLKIGVDAAPKIGFSSSHNLWPFVVGLELCGNSFKPQREAFLQWERSEDHAVF
jgi:hypothetical protein